MRPGRVVEFHGRSSVVSSIGEEPGRLGGHIERRRLPDALSGHPEPFTAGSNNGDCRAGLEDASDDVGGRGQHVFAVVEYDEHLHVAQAFQEAFPDAAILLTGVMDPTGRAHGPDESLDLEELRRGMLGEAIALRLLAEV